MIWKPNVTVAAAVERDGHVVFNKPAMDRH